MNPYIFREYDIRGIVKKDLRDQDVYLIGRAFATYINKKGAQNIAISGDIRESTPAIKESFTNGMLDSGVNVLDIGIVPTPANYYSMYKLQIDGAVQITGSHNPPEFNGIKLSFNKKPFYGQDIQNLLEIIKEQSFVNGKGILKEENILDKYHLMLKNKIDISRPLKVVMDCANASACLSAPQLFLELGIEVKELFCKIDNTFPNHHPDPTEDDNLRFMIDEIKKGNFDFGVAFDGDADRIVAIDELGNIIRSDILMTLFLPDIIKIL